MAPAADQEPTSDTYVAMRLLPQRVSGREIQVHPGGVFIIHEH